MKLDLPGPRFKLELEHTKNLCMLQESWVGRILVVAWVGLEI